MIDAVWTGLAPAKEVARSLRAAGVRVHRARDGQGGTWVVATRAGKLAPEAPAGGQPWLWVSGSAIEQAAAEHAATRGAYDGVDLSKTGAVARIVQRLRELAVEDGEPPVDPTFVGKSEASRRVLAQLARAARTSMPVLITGETGTGKEVAARLVHAWSARHGKRFVPINCAAIPDDLMEAELFGYARGAFSGAVHAYDGQVMAAEGGTVFLDEIDDTPTSIQVKLLRVLEDRVVSRLGENEWHEVDFRLVAATNRDLGPLIASGAFGADLFQRLAIVRIELPPLRERIAELPTLVEHFVARFYEEEPEARARTHVSRIAPETLSALEAYPWPGNVRELRNVVFRALVEKRAGDELLLSDLPRRILQRGAAAAPATSSIVDASALARAIERGDLNLRRELDVMRRLALEAALARCGGNATEAARLLGEVGRGASQDPGGTVRAMMRRLGMPLPRRRKA